MLRPPIKLVAVIVLSHVVRVLQWQGPAVIWFLSDAAGLVVLQ